MTAAKLLSLITDLVPADVGVRIEADCVMIRANTGWRSPKEAASHMTECRKDITDFFDAVLPGTKPRRYGKKGNPFAVTYYDGCAGDSGVIAEWVLPIPLRKPGGFDFAQRAAL